MAELCTRFKRRVFLVAAVCCFNSSVRCSAVTTSWIANANGNFTTAGNWDNGVPDSDDTAVFDGIVNYTVTFPGSLSVLQPRNYLIDYLRIGDDDVTFVDNSTGTIQPPSLTVANPGVFSIVIGENLGDISTLRTTLHSLSGTNASIGLVPGAIGRLYVGGGTVNISSLLRVGHSGGGDLHVSNGASVSSGFASLGLLGEGSRGLATITGAGSTWTNSNTLTIGEAGRGTLVIENGGSVLSSIGMMGEFSDSNGVVTVTGASSTWTNSGDLTVGFNGMATLRVEDGGTVSVGGSLFVNAGGTLAGNGMVSASIINRRGRIAPGVIPGTVTGASPAPGALHVDGSLVQEADGNLQVRLAGTTPATQYDQLQVSGAVTLNGTLSVALANLFVPSAGTTFDILDWGSLSGTFSTVQLPSLAAGLTWNTSQLYTSGVISVLGPTLPGDYNQNGTVDAADYVRWRDNLGSGTSLPNDDSPGVALDDYTRWRTHFGQTARSGAGASANAAIPEPATLFLLALVTAGGCLRQRRVA